MIIDDKNYVKKAENVILNLKNQDRNNKLTLTTSKIRNLLSMTTDIYNEVLSSEENLSDELCGRIDYLKIRFVYEAGREKTVNSFVNVAEILECLDDIKGSKKKFILFNRYMEALVAYHKFYGGKEN